MATLLKIDVSPRGDYSVSRALGKTFADKWLEEHAGGEIISHDLATMHLPFVDMPWIMGAYSDPAGHTEEQKAALKIGDDFIADLVKAEEYVITTPMYNFAVPAKLKAWIDHIVRSGKTFQVNSDGSYTGLLSGKKATVIIGSMGTYLPGTPTEGYDFERPYIKHVLGFIGVTDVTFVQAGGTWKVDRGVETREDFLAPFEKEVEGAVS